MLGGLLVRIALSVCLVTSESELVFITFTVNRRFRRCQPNRGHRTVGEA
jgi:hypothetical protein